MSLTAWKAAIRRALSGASKPRLRRRLRPHLLTLEERAVPAGNLVEDINPVATGQGSDPASLTDVNGTLFFTKFTPTIGFALWKSDGTVAGTTLVKDIHPNLGSTYYAPIELTNVNGTLFFSADAGDGKGYELWKSDGTPGGTVPVADINPTGSSYPVNLTNANGILYFTAFNEVDGRELWKSDPVSGTTSLVSDIAADELSSIPTLLTVMGGTLYFAADDQGTFGRELWKTDLTTGVTSIVKDILVGEDPSSPASLTVVGSTLFFVANDGVRGYELWSSGGTDLTTDIVRDIVDGPFSTDPRELIAVGSTLFFTADDGTNGMELWSSGGTLLTTNMVEDIHSSGGSYPYYLTAVGGVLYFQANAGTGDGSELWKSGGSEANTEQVADINTTAGDGSYPRYFTEVGGVVYFSAANAVNGESLWKTTGSGATLVKDLDANNLYNGPTGLTVSNGKLFFVGNDGIHGSQLWVSDGTPTGTVNVEPFLNPTYSSYPYAGVEFNGKLYFSAFDGVNGRELWVSDGTAAGTAMVDDIYAGGLSSFPANLTVSNGKLYFTADDGVSGRELWSFNGTTTSMVDNIDGAANSSLSIYSADLTDVNGTLYFVADDGVTGVELWSFDGSNAQIVADIFVGPIGSYPYQLTPLGSTLYFVAEEEDGLGRLLRSSDDPNSYIAMTPTPPQYLTAVNGKLYFSAETDTGGEEVWTSNGTAAGTYPLADLYPGTPESNPREFTAFGGFVYFSAVGDDGRELWRTDGTSGGTVLALDLYPGTNGSYPLDFTVSNGKLYFSATVDSTTRQLWVSDGTIGGTVQLTTFDTPGYAGAPYDLTNLNGSLFFTAFDEATGRELWKSDGTIAGTGVETDASAGVGSSSPQYLTTVGNQLFFTATTAAAGNELWVTSAAPPIPTVTINQAGSQADPTATASVDFTVVFSEPVTGFAASDVLFTDSTATGTFAASVTELAPHDGTTYRVTVSITGLVGEGTIVASIPAGAAKSTANNVLTSASTSTDNNVTFAIVPTVTINQGATQPDLATSGPIIFDVVFSEAVTGFTGSDIDFTGSTAGAGLVATVTPVAGSMTNYTVSVSGMSMAGQVQVSIPAESAVDANLNGNPASTTADNIVLFNAAGSISLTSATYTAVEGGTAVQVIVRRVGSVGVITFDYAFTNGSAETLDYTVTPNASDSEGFADSETGDIVFTVLIPEDTLSEGFETINVALTAITGQATPLITSAVVTVAPSDGSTTFTDADNDIATLKVKGGGTAMFYLTDGALPISLVELVGTDPIKSIVTLTVKKALRTNDGLISIPSISGTGAKVLNFAKASLDGDGIELSGIAQVIKLNSIVNGADISTTGSVLKKKTKILVKEEITGTAGNRVVIDLDGPVSTIKAGGTVDFTDIFVGSNTGTVAGNIGLVSVGDFKNSRVFAGYEGNDVGTTMGGFNTAFPATIGTFRTVKSVKFGTTGLFENSSVIASIIRSATIVSLDSSNPGVTFGIFADTSFTTVTVKATTTTPGKQVFKKSIGDTIEDFSVQVV